MIVRLLALLLVLFVCACGDGGSDGHADAPTPTATPLPGTLDAAFGDVGTATTDFDGRGDVAHAIAVQSDGRIVVAGRSLPLEGDVAFAAARFLPDGTLDASFGTGGRVLTVPPDHGFTEPTDVAIDGAGRIVLAGSTSSGMQIVRYSPAGDVDPSFGAGGFFVGPHVVGGRSIVLVPQPGGAIIAAGTVADTHVGIVVVRLSEDGRLDASFGIGGIAMVGGFQFADMVRRADGTLVIGGIGSTVVDGVEQRAFVIARLTRDGTLDPSFGNDGTVATAIGSEIAELIAIAVGADGSIMAAGFAGPFPTHGHGLGGSLVLARYDAAGVLEPTYGDAGLVRTGIDVLSSAVVAIDPEGPIYVADATVDGQPFSAARVRRLDATGVLDPTFGDGGSFVRHVRPDDESAFQALALLPDGRLLAAGFSRVVLGDYDFAVARLWR